MTSSAADSKNPEEKKNYTKKEIKTFVSDIEKKTVESDGAYLHSIVALNEILRAPNIESVMDDELKGQMKDLWIKLKSSGVQLADPPVLFGLPEDFGQEEELAVESEDVPELEGDDYGPLEDKKPQESEEEPETEESDEQEEEKLIN